MSSLAIQTDIDTVSGKTVYGLKMKSYTIDGTGGYGILEAAAFAALRQSHTIEAATNSIAAVVKLRQKKATDLGEALAIIAEAVASMDPKEQDPEDKVSCIGRDKIAKANAILVEYGIEAMPTNGDGEVNYSTANYKQTDVQLFLDNENNDLQQDMVSLQGLVNKRDNAFGVANKIVAKINSTYMDTINAYGM